MVIIGVLGLIGMILLAVVAAGLMVWGGWRAMRDELVARNFRSNPPHAGGLALTLLGVVLPVVVIALFLLALAVWLLSLVLVQIPQLQ